MTTPVNTEITAEGEVELLPLSQRMRQVRDEVAKDHDMGIWGEVLHLFEIVSAQQVQINGLLAARVKDLEDKAAAQEAAAALAAVQARIAEQQAAQQAVLDAILAAQAKIVGGA